MSKILFILGSPGSGKSTAARVIVEYVKEKRQDWSLFRINDYEILWAMFESDTEGKKFRSLELDPLDPTSPESNSRVKGFDVTDFSVLDDALTEATIRIRKYLTESEKGLITVEFARNDYKHALEEFRSFLQNEVYFLFLEVEKSTCWKRIQRRVLHHNSMDDHFVSEFIFESYYHKDTMPYTPADLAADFGIDTRRVEVIDNNGLEVDFLEKARRFVDVILGY